MNNVENLDLAQRYASSIRPPQQGFPVLAEVLRQAGVRGTAVSVASGDALYVMDGGTVFQPGVPLHRQPVTVPGFDRAALVDAIDADKAGEIGFPEFLRRSWAAGVVRYEVDTGRRTCTYLGAAGEQYIERYPAITVELPDVSWNVRAVSASARPQEEFS